MSALFEKLMNRDEKVCPWWLAWTFDNPLRKWLHDPRQILGDYIKEGMTVADIGCGMGYFSVAMARMIGPTGRVIAVDLQQMMLDLLRKRAFRAGVADRINTILAAPEDISIAEPADFVLAFWMVHEVKDIPRFFGQVASVLKPGSRMLYAEPRIHVTQRRFDDILGFAKAAGFSVEPGPAVGMSRAAVLVR
ncbi:MAG: class I SAM-dependent methyltransferase [Nitrospiraceae bacterium]|nr:class I SAM-dependent methyltransferase [Nitrospiraceae bacterium]